MVRTRSMTAVLRNRNLIKTKAAPPKSKSKAAQPKSKRKAAQLKRSAVAAEEEKKRMAAFKALDVDNILRLKREAMAALQTKRFPAKLAAAGQTQQSGAEGEEKVVPEKKKKVLTYLVSQRYIDHMKEAGLFQGVQIPEDELAEESQHFRDAYRTKVFLSEKLRACQQVLLDQYNTFGYAYDAQEVTDDEAEDDGEGEGMLVVKN